MIYQDKTDQINTWLQGFNELRLECDGMTRALSALLVHNNIDHEVHTGRLETRGDKPEGIFHFWIEIDDNYIIDLRARMWLGDDAPNGIFKNESLSVVYKSFSVTKNPITDPFMFSILTDMQLADSPPFPVMNNGLEPAPARRPSEASDSLDV